MGAQELAWLATLTSLDWTFGAACSLSQRAHYRVRLHSFHHIDDSVCQY